MPTPKPKAAPAFDWAAFAQSVGATLYAAFQNLFSSAQGELAQDELAQGLALQSSRAIQSGDLAKRERAASMLPWLMDYYAKRKINVENDSFGRLLDITKGVLDTLIGSLLPFHAQLTGPSQPGHDPHFVRDAHFDNIEATIRPMDVGKPISSLVRNTSTPPGFRPDSDVFGNAQGLVQVAAARPKAPAPPRSHMTPSKPRPQPQAHTGPLFKVAARTGGPR